MNHKTLAARCTTILRYARCLCITVLGGVAGAIAGVIVSTFLLAIFAHLVCEDVDITVYASILGLSGIAGVFGLCIGASVGAALGGWKRQASESGATVACPFCGRVNSVHTLVCPRCDRRVEEAVVGSSSRNTA